VKGVPEVVKFTDPWRSNVQPFKERLDFKESQRENKYRITIEVLKEAR
jgi:hypothetical protein